MSTPEANRQASVWPDSPQARVAAIRQRIAHQREGFPARFQSLIPSRLEQRQPKPFPVFGIGVVLTAALVLVTFRRARVITQAAISTGWLAWRGLRLARALSTALVARPSRTESTDQGRTRAS
jgi:hypothetical protein